MKAWEQEIIDKFGSFLVKVNPDSPVYEIIGQEVYDGKYHWVLRNFETGHLMSPCFTDGWIPLKIVETEVEEFVPFGEQPTHYVSSWGVIARVASGAKYGKKEKVRKVTWEPI